MNRMTDSDKSWGPFTLAPWRGSFSAYIRSGDDEDPECVLLFIAFGWALRIHIPAIIQPHKEKKMALSWDVETVKRLGRNWYYDVDERHFGFSLSNMGNGYDFLQIKYGRQTHDSLTDKTWSKHLPWKQWNCVRHSVYDPDGKHFATEPRNRRGMASFREWMDACEKCPASYFGFEDFDGEMIVATCRIEEREWHRGEGWFKWLKWFWPAKIRRSLDIKFSAEVGPEKGSWKGGTIGHGIEMDRIGDTAFCAFVRYCEKEHDARQGRKYKIRFIGFAEPPPPKPKPESASANAERA
jgi:hypothetical protein